MREGDVVLHGGVANAGGVVRSGPYVLRPSNEHSNSILRFLSRLEAVGFHGVPSPVGLDPDGRERLRFIPGEVAIPPFPAWVQSHDALVSVTALIRELHDASEVVVTNDLSWPTDATGRGAGRVICHNDVCFENVVFRDGRAVALLDFDFAGPGRRTFDIAAFARMCVPIDDDFDLGRLGWRHADRPARLRLICDTYGLDEAARREVLRLIGILLDRHSDFVRRRVEGGDPGYVKMWQEMGGMERLDRRRRWWLDALSGFEAALS